MLSVGIQRTSWPVTVGGTFGGSAALALSGGVRSTSVSSPSAFSTTFASRFSGSSTISLASDIAARLMASSLLLFGDSSNCSNHGPSHQDVHAADRSSVSVGANTPRLAKQTVRSSAFRLVAGDPFNNRSRTTAPLQRRALPRRAVAPQE